MVVSGASLGIEAIGDGNGFEQSGLAASVFPDEAGDRAAKFELFHASQRGYGAEVAPGSDPAPVDGDTSDKLRIHRCPL